jgi:hypothetical protein
MTFGMTRLFARIHRRFGDLSANLFTLSLPSAIVSVLVACTILARVYRPREFVGPSAVDRDFSMRVIDPADLLSEDEVLRRWPMLTEAELRRARRANPPRIEFYGFRKKGGGPRYTPEQVQSYIDRTYLRVSECQQIDSGAPQQALSSSGDSNSAPTISSARIQSISASGMLADMTPELAKSAAEVLRQQISKRPKSGSRRSSRLLPAARTE